MLTDHGELWYRPWQVLEAKNVPNELASVTLAVDDPELLFRFERTLTLPDGPGPEPDKTEEGSLWNWAFGNSEKKSPEQNS